MKIAKLLFLESVNTDLMSGCRRHERLFPNSREFAVTILNAIGASPSVPFALNGFKSSFIAFIGKDRSDLARPFKFSMGIVGIAAKQLKAFKKAVKIKRAIYIKTGLLKRDADHLFAFLVIILIVIVLVMIVMVMVVVILFIMTFFFMPSACPWEWPPGIP